MDIIHQLLPLLDHGVDANLSATLAGLSLAAAAFFTPQSIKLLEEATKQKQRLESMIERGNGYGIFGETGLTNELEETNKNIKYLSDTSDGFIKAFILFSILIIYTITIDRFIGQYFPNNTLSPLFSSIEAQTFDVLASFIFLSWGGIYLGKGVVGISNIHKLKFDFEANMARDFLKSLKSQPTKKSQNLSTSQKDSHT